jgi:serine/threonine protein kinase
MTDDSVSVVRYLHSNLICHRDLKDENVVVDKNLVVRTDADCQWRRR